MGHWRGSLVFSKPVGGLFGCPIGGKPCGLVCSLVCGPLGSKGIRMPGSDLDGCVVSRKAMALSACDFLMGGMPAAQAKRGLALFATAAHCTQMLFIAQTRLIFTVQAHAFGVGQRMVDGAMSDPPASCRMDPMPMRTCGVMPLSCRMHDSKGRNSQRKRQQGDEREPGHRVLRRERVVEQGQNTEACPLREVPEGVLASFENFFGNGRVTAYKFGRAARIVAIFPGDFPFQR